MNAKTAVLLLGSLGLAALGCQPSLDSWTITPVTTPPLAATVSGTNIVIPEGVALAVEIVVTNSDDHEVTDALIAPLNDVLGLEAIKDSDNQYVIHGDAVGTGLMGCTSPSNDGTLNVPVTVTAQP